MNRLLVLAVVACMAVAGAQELVEPPPHETGGDVLPAPTYVADPNPDRVKNVMFMTVPPNYLHDHAEFFARNRIDGIMMNNLMGGWESDIWALPTTYAPDAPKGRVVGADNPLFQMCQRANARCRALGVASNSVKIAFSRALPDWFDDGEWTQIAERFRQAAVFARDAGFAGIALDAEYVSDQYKLDYPAYQAPGYPRDQVKAQALQRGREIMCAMLDAFPGMVFWLLPEIASSNDWLANDLFAGFVSVLAERDAPGGLHLCVERTYLLTRPRSIVWAIEQTNKGIRHALEQAKDPRVFDYWQRRGTTAVGLWPLGFYREFKDADGTIIGYSGRKDVFGNELVGSMADKSENYSVEEFRRALATARMVGRAYMWQYCHGQVFWQLTPEEKDRYLATPNDVLPTAPNVDAYLAVMRERMIIDDPLLVAAAEAVREQRPMPMTVGHAPAWEVSQAFPLNRDRFGLAFTPPDAVEWRSVVPAADGYVDLRKAVGGAGEVVVYAKATARASVDGRVYLRIGSNDYSAVAVDGRPVYRFMQSRPAVVDDDAIALDLAEGDHQIMVQCADVGGKFWGFYLRLGDEGGNEAPSVSWVGAQPR